MKLLSDLRGNVVVPFGELFGEIDGFSDVLLHLFGGVSSGFVQSRMTLTVVRSPVEVEAFRVRAVTVSSVSNSMPVQTRLRCGKKRRSIGLYLEQ